MRELERLQALTEQPIQPCYPCQECRARCPALPAMDRVPDRVLYLLKRGCRAQMRASCDVRLCPGGEMCGTHCPNGVDVGDVLIALRELAAQEGYRREDCAKLCGMLRDEPGETRVFFFPETDDVAVDDRLGAGAELVSRAVESAPGEGA